MLAQHAVAHLKPDDAWTHSFPVAPGAGFERKVRLNCLTVDILREQMRCFRKKIKKTLFFNNMGLRES
jgi:hypothetical protein